MAIVESCKRRAGVVCVACNLKKIKCDLQQKRGARCSNCTTAQRDCILRKSKRGSNQRSSKNPSRLPYHSGQDVERPPNALVHINADSDSPNQPINIVQNTEAPRAYSISSELPNEHSTELSDDGPGIMPYTSSTFLNAPEAAKSYFGQTGFLQVYGPETELDAAEQRDKGTEEAYRDLKLPSPNLQQSFIESYFENCYTWCPVLERESLSTELGHSRMLLCALSLAGSHVQPPLIAHAGPATYYAQAKELFYSDQETNPILCLKGLTLFYWWSPRPPTTLHKNSSWWTSAAIRYAQQCGLHRELTFEQQQKSGISPNVQRRIWWTLFSRERLTAVCQSRPTLIDPSDCSIREISVEDFPDPRNKRAEIFVHWVRLCGIIGRIAKFLSRPQESTSTTPFPSQLVDELIGWVYSLPERLKLPIDQDLTKGFDRDVHQLHLPYLSVIIILNLNRSSGYPPKAYAAAMMAATSMARIYRDLLSRGTIRFLLPISCWYSGMAFLALLQARRIARFKAHADFDIDTIDTVLKQLRAMWPTANIFISGIERLLNNESRMEYTGDSSANINDPRGVQNSGEGADPSSINAVGWTRYFPWATSQVSGLANELLEDHYQNQDLLLPSENWRDSVNFQLHDLFEPFDPFSELMPTL